MMSSEEKAHRKAIISQVTTIYNHGECIWTHNKEQETTSSYTAVSQEMQSKITMNTKTGQT